MLTVTHLRSSAHSAMSIAVCRRSAELTPANAGLRRSNRSPIIAIGVSCYGTASAILDVRSGSSKVQGGETMSDSQAFRYDGKRALVVGGATGMGAAAAQTVTKLGGEVIVMDYAPIEFPVSQAIKVDLRDLSDLDAALAQVDGPIHALFNAAGVADGPNLMKINFIGHRHIIETMIDD